MKVLYWPEVPDSLKQVARSLCPPDVELTWLPGNAAESDLLSHLEDVECLLGRPPRSSSSRVAAALGRLKLVQLLSAGYDYLDLEQMREFGVVVCNNGGANAISVAEHAVLLMLAVLRRLTEIDAQLRAGEFKPLRPGESDIHELCGSTVGLVGFGPIGREVARRLRGFQVNTRYYDVVKAPPEVEAELGAELLPLDRLLAESDIVSLHVPLNDQTRALINDQTLARMKRGAVLINTARGELVDEEALARAIASGALRGAGLDVFSVEPPPPDHPLLRLGHRVIATPHVAGPTWESWPRRFRNAFANVERVRRGEPPLWILPELRA